MMIKIRGEYISDSGEKSANQFTLAGMKAVLESAFRETSPGWFMGLCAHNPANAIALASVNEPTIGVNGYARQPLNLNAASWPVIGTINNETYVESISVTFALTGAVDKGVNRLFLTDGTDVLSISSPFAKVAEVLDSPVSHKYRLYFS